MGDADRRLLDAALRNDFQAFLRRTFIHLNGRSTFQPTWHLRAIEHYLKAVERGGARLIINVPPRSLKSISISVAYVAWRLGRDPTLRFICVSYAQEFSLKLARDCREIMLYDWYRRAFPETELTRAVEGELETSAGGGRFATSVGGVLTGRGGDVIIIDDPTKPGDAASVVERAKAIEWFGATLQSRLDDKVNGSIVLVMQRLHEGDLSGHLLEGGGWDLLALPAIAELDEAIPIGDGEWHQRRTGDLLHPSREPIEELDRLKAGMGSANFAAQYQQAPVPEGGAMVRREWLRSYAQPPERLPGDRIVQSWDCAGKDGALNDYSACVTALVRGRDVYVLHVWRGQVLMNDLQRQVVALATAFRPDTLLVEDTASGTALIQLLRAERPQSVPRPIAITVKLDKVTRLSQACPRIEAGELLLPAEAAWRADFERELLGFPNTRTDDQVDALSQLLNWQTGHREPSLPVGPVAFTMNRDTGHAEVFGDPWTLRSLGLSDEPMEW
ncbi:MAG: phage terminase large subunit [Phenylobacterium sp.]|nr:phage terminase large subunit [Phenylobacterium sp.]